MSLWLLLSLIALFLWGLFGVFSNLASRHLDGYNAAFWEAVGAVAVGIFVLIVLLRVVDLQLKPRGVVFGLATGIALHLGMLFVLFALSLTAVGGSEALSESADGETGHSGKVHTILVLTAMYPLIGAVLNYLVLDEPFSMRQLIGMAVGLGAIAIFLLGE